MFGLITVVSLLTGCDKPQPTVTALSNDRSTIVPAQPGCTMLPTAACSPDPSKQKSIKASGGSQILLDVPLQLANAGWIVTAFTGDGTTNTPLTTPAGVSTGPIHGVHTVRLNVPAATAGSYFLQVTALKASKQLTNWLIAVQLTQ